ncbi:MAG: glycoside hydrolase family 97 catalytic domain-containing protein, partial [Rhodothermales bacterium]|nr:glycoside hydrolase family 97 catalytic domain-containing protein [Rhodothermales bacterium]
ISIHEAALVDYASMTLARRAGNVLKADLVPWSDGVKVRASAPMVTPWRTVQVADNAGELLTSNLILNLNEPNRLEDTSWIKPGKYVGIWWEMHLGKSTWGSGSSHGATTENAMRYIDFAADYGFDGVLVEGWNIGWDGDWINGGDGFRFTQPYDDFDLEAVATYALQKGTRLIGHHETAGSISNYEAQMEDAFTLYSRLGVRAVKTGYVGFGRQIKRYDNDGSVQYETHHGQHMVNHYARVVETAARHRIMINAHEPIKPTGLQRTYPNLMTQEGARGQEYNSPEGGGNPPEHTVILPFTRLLAGPMDFTPGVFQLVPAEDEPENNVPTTLAKQLALYLVIYSPLHMAADLPHNYLEQPEAFEFVRTVPTNWHETKVLHAEVGDYLTVARKDWDSEDWYLGSVTDEEGRMLRANLSFLAPHVLYVATVYRDAADAHWQENPLGFARSEVVVDRSTTATLRLAPGGGVAIRFRPVPDGAGVIEGLPRCDGPRVCDPDFGSPID